MTNAEIIRELLHEEQTAERVKMIAKVQRKRVQKERTLTIQAARRAKWAMQGRS